MSDPFSSPQKAKKATKQKKTLFKSKSTNLPRNQSYLAKPTFSSPTKLNVVSLDWKKQRSNSLIMTKGDSSLSQQTSPSRRTLKRAKTTDRFIPSGFSSSCRLYDEGENPEPTDSPKKHLEFHSTKIYKHSMAQICGVNLDQKILQFQPAPPENKKVIDLHSQFSHTLNEGLSKILIQSKVQSGGISPTNVLARSKKIPSIPERILDAPGLVDDYYLNLLSWSLTNLLAVALERAVYIWHASEGNVNLLTECDSIVTSVSWSDDGSYLTIGKDNGTVEVWDIEDNTKLRTMQVGDTRIANHCWSNHLVTSGSRSGEISNSDVRVAKHLVSSLKTHSAEVCGLSWRHDGAQLASGGNDNLVAIWDSRSLMVPQFIKSTHTAAVKALSWCDHQTSLLASGGGSNDRCIHFWNTATGARVNSLNTGAQVTSINWGYAKGTENEIVATSGFPANSISVYSYPSLQKTGEIINSHDSRVLYSALSPDGTTLATAAGDENLKFWKIFDINSGKKVKPEAQLNTGKAIMIR